MKGTLFMLRHRWRRFKYPPIVEVSHSGQLTARPQVHVSACGMTGSQTVYTWNADRQGEASASLYGKGLADIMQCRFVDRRQNIDLFVSCYEKVGPVYRCKRCNSAQLGCTPEVCNFKFSDGFDDVRDDMPLRQLGDEE